MWVTLTVYGIIVAIFGFFLMFITGAFGFVMIITSIILNPPDREKPDDVTKKYCNYCIAEINKIDKICPICNQEVN